MSLTIFPFGNKEQIAVNKVVPAEQQPFIPIRFAIRHEGQRGLEKSTNVLYPDALAEIVQEAETQFATIRDAAKTMTGNTATGGVYRQVEAAAAKSTETAGSMAMADTVTDVERVAPVVSLDEARAAKTARSTTDSASPDLLGSDQLDPEAIRAWINRISDSEAA